jgi:uncharacterized protein
MNPLVRWLEELASPSGSRKSRDKEVRLCVRNATRGVEIASCVELADTAAKRSKGLLGRSGLPPGHAIWIAPCEAVHTFGMQFAIDLIYLDRQRRIRKIRSNVGPWRVSACLRAHSVIELAAGSVRDTHVGDHVEFSPAVGGESGSDSDQSPERHAG